MKDFVNFHTKTSYSLLQSLIKPAELFKRAKELNQSAVGVADINTLACAHDGLKYSKEAGVKLIMGGDFYFTEHLDNTNVRLRHILFFAKNHIGYKNLLKISKLGFDNKITSFKKEIGRINWDIVENHSDGLICLTGCSAGILGQLLNTRQSEEARKTAIRLKGIFGDNLGLEIDANGLQRVQNNYRDYEDQKFVNHQVIKLGKELDIRVVASCNARFLHPEQYESVDAILAIGSSQPLKSGNRLTVTPDHRLKSRDEIIQYFSMYGTKAEEFCDNTLYFSELCESPDWISPKFTNPSGKELPEFPVKLQKDYDDFKVWWNNSNLKDKTERSAYLRYWVSKEFDKKVPSDKIELYKTRLEEEFEVFEFHGFSSYMLITADFLQWCREKCIPVGPGRGSVGGSCVAYLTNIHCADPIKYNLIFARFQNKHRTAFPDCDNDISPQGREQLHNYLREKYGSDNVAHVSNINTLTPKVYARSISRALQYGGDAKAAVAIGAAIADSIPKELKTLDEAFEKAPLFAEFANSPKYIHLKKFAKDLAGIPIANSTHAGGIVIGMRPLMDIVPLRRDKEGAISLEYEKERAEENGLIKIDILGLETLDIIEKTYEIIESVGKTPPPKDFDYEQYDQKAYDLISSGNTLGVFQLGQSTGTMALCQAIKPKCIEDISLVNSLARPSAKDMRSDFVEVRAGRKPMTLLHPSLKRAFESTYGFGLFEECLLFLAQDVAGWDLHKADGLRKLTKEKGKNPKKAAQLKADFIDGGVKNGIEIEAVTKIWDEVVDKFQGYGFNACLYLDELVNVYDSLGNFIDSKKIKDIVPGEYVKSFDQAAKSVIYVKVVENHNNGLKEIFEVELESGQKVKCTMDHKFRVKETNQMVSLKDIIKKNLSIVALDV